jgi:hypothetical protein
MRGWWGQLTPEQRRAHVARRDRALAREADRRRNSKPARRQHLRENAIRWRANNPEKVRAHSRVAHAVRRGDLVRQPCEECGSTETHAHHDDYSKPLEVRWLCAVHHAAETRGAMAR